MFRAVFVAIVALTLSITVVASYTTHQSNARESIEAGVSQSLRGAATLAVLERDTEVASARAKATFVSADDGLAEAITKSYLAELPEAEGDTAKDRAAKAAHERHIKVHERLLSYEKRFELYGKGEGKGKRDLELPLRYRGNTQPDLFFAVDSSGVGLAALGKDLFDWYGEDLSGEYPEIAKAMTSKSVQTAVWEFGFAKQGGEKSLYTVAVSPVFKGGEGEAVGAIVVGNLFNKGVAVSTRDYVAGVDGFVEIHGRDGSPSEDEAVAAERRGVEAALADAPHVAFVRSGAIIASSMDPATEKATAARLADTIKDGAPGELVRLEDPEGEAPTLLVRGQALPRRKDDGTNTGVIVIRDLSAALAPMEEPARQSLIWFVLSLILGTVGVLAVFQIFLKPVGDVEAGVQEIIAGNKDYTFQAPNWHKTASSLAQQLNLMSAFLQGKPMPDDDGVAGSNWGDFGGGGGGAKQAPQGGSQVQGVSMQDLMGRKPSDDA
jgi:hypothetical protein